MSDTTEDELFFMVNIRGRSSGLPMNVWVSPRGRARHAASIKVQSDHHERFNVVNLAVVSVDDDPPRLIEGQLDGADLEQVRRFIELNRDAIIDHWLERTDGIELSRSLRPVRPFT